MTFFDLGPADGSIYQGNLRSANATDVFILVGNPEGEVFEPHFTYHGFRYVQVLESFILIIF